MAQSIAAERVKQAEFAEVLLNTCPFCLNTLKFGNESLNQDIEIVDLLELIDQLME